MIMIMISIMIAIMITIMITIVMIMMNKVIMTTIHKVAGPATETKEGLGDAYKAL